MTTVEKAAYLKGLAEGIGYMNDKKEGKLWDALCDLISDMAHEIEDLQMNGIDMAEALNDLTESVNELEELTADLDLDDELWEDDDEDDDNSGKIYNIVTGEFEYPTDDELEDEDDEPLEYDGIIYDAICPNCAEEISFTEETLAEGSMLCPNCGEKLEFDLSDEEEDEIKF